MNKFYTDKDLDITKDLEDKAKRSKQRRDDKTKSIRSLYIPKIRKLKKKVKKEFEDKEQIEFVGMRLYGGKGGEVSKDMIVLKITVKKKSGRKEILSKIEDFLYKAFDLLSLTQFFIPKNFGTQEVKDNNRVEMVFLKQNHDWDYIKDKPYIVGGDDEEEEPGGPPSPGGGFGEEPPDVGGGGGPSPDIGGDETPEPDSPEPEGGEGGGGEEPE